MQIYKRKYGEKVRITRKMLLADDFDYYQSRFASLLKATKEAARVYLDAVKAKRELDR